LPAAAWLAVVLLPLASLPLFGMASVSSPTNIALLGFVAFAAVSIASARAIPAYWHELGGGILAMLGVWMLLSAFFGDDPTEELRGAVTAIGAIVFYYAGSCLAYGDGRGWRWETAIFTSALAAAAVGVLHYAGLLAPFAFEAPVAAGRQIGSFQFSGGRYMGLFNAPGDYDIWLLSGVMVAHRWMFKPDCGVFVKMAAGGCALIMIAAELVSQSRSGWITFAVFLAIFWVGAIVSKTKTRWSKVYTLGVMVALALVAIDLLAISGIVSAIGRGFVDVSNYSVLARFAGYDDAIKTIIADPVFGGGRVLAHFGGNEYIVHNAVLAYMSSYGVIAGIFFLVPVFYFIFKSIKNVSRERRTSFRCGDIAISVALVALLISISLNPALGSKVLFALLGCASGVIKTRGIDSGARQWTVGEESDTGIGFSRFME